MPDIRARIAALQRKINEAETELAIVQRDIEKTSNELKETFQIKDLKDVDKLASETQSKMNTYQKKIESLLAKAEEILQQYEAQNADRN
jgi:peptidoglycan hydrolase CwlO-like protein